MVVKHSIANITTSMDRVTGLRKLPSFFLSSCELSHFLCHLSTSSPPCSLTQRKYGSHSLTPATSRTSINIWGGKMCAANYTKGQQYLFPTLVWGMHLVASLYEIISLLPAEKLLQTRSPRKVFCSDHHLEMFKKTLALESVMSLCSCRSRIKYIGKAGYHKQGIGLSLLPQLVYKINLTPHIKC